MNSKNNSIDTPELRELFSHMIEVSGERSVAWDEECVQEIVSHIHAWRDAQISACRAAVLEQAANECGKVAASDTGEEGTQAAIDCILNIRALANKSSELAVTAAQGLDTDVDAVTLESAREAIEHVEQHNGPGRAAQASKMLVPIKVAPIAEGLDWKRIVENVLSYHKQGIYDDKMAIYKLRGAQEDEIMIVGPEPEAYKPHDYWTMQPPTEQGEYWHWNGDYDTAPYIYHILWSGTAKKCFVSVGQYGITEASFCDEFGGWWKRIPQASIPDELSIAIANSGAN